ncbi:MAG: homoserine dehydrogenase [Oscillospiraceae bacterium]|nr:homoserine dehydrogenase [Oscillospiraceae bacterium]
MTKIAILGYGVVGSGVAEVLHNSAAMIEARRGIALSVKSILDIRRFPGDPFEHCFVSSFDDIENDLSVRVVVETIGGTGAAYDFTKRALKSGKHVVTSNKELVAEHGPELLELAREKQVNYLFEAAVGGGTPLIYPLAQCLSANRISSVCGILNGTCNYILTRMRDNGFTFDEALLEAQKSGYAEGDPSDDILGHDTARKISILASLVIGRQIFPKHVQTMGINRVTPEHLREAADNGYAIKLIGRVTICESSPPVIYAEPHLLKRGHPLFAVDGVFNAVLITGDVVGDVLFYGKGAGKEPTASAVVSDIVACMRANDPLGGLAWYEIPVRLAQPDSIHSAPHHTFTDGTTLRVM